MKNLTKALFLLSISIQAIRNPFEPVKERQEYIKLPILLAITEENNKLAALIKQENDTAIFFINDNVGPFKLIDISNKDIKLEKNKDIFTIEL